MKRAAVVLVYVAVLVVVGLLCLSPARDPDLGFHLATGRAVLALGHVPATNVLSFTETDTPWVLQQWLPATLFELGWRRFGPVGPLAIKIAVVVATWACVLAASRRLGARSAAGAAVVVVGAWASAFRFVERPLIFSNLALAAVVLCLADHHVLGPAASPRRRAAPLVAAAGITALACHLHAGAIFPMLALVAAAVGIAMEPLRWRALGAKAGERPERTGAPGFTEGPAGLRPGLAVGAVLVAAVAIAAVTLAVYHPYGLRVIEVPFTMEADAYFNEHLLEFRPPLRFPFAPMASFWALFVATALLVLARLRRVPLSWSFLVAGFAALALRHVRLIDAFAIVAAVPLSVEVSALASGLGERAARPVGVAALAAASIVAPLDHGSRYPRGTGLDPGIWPMDLFGVVTRAGLTGPAFVSDVWAGSWIGLYYPRERSFFDNRLDAYSARFAREVYQATRYGQPGWDANLDKYGVQLVILRYTTPGEARYQGGQDNLRQLLARDPRWSLVAFDDRGEIFVRRDGPNAAQAKELAIPGVDPDRMTFVGPKQEAAAGLAAAEQRLPPSARVRALAEASRAAR